MTQVIYHPSAGAPVPVHGIFDNVFRLTARDASAPIEGLDPKVFLRIADLPSDPMIDDPILTIEGVDYRVDRRMPAGFGTILLILRKAG